jgi:hypothetical protein
MLTMKKLFISILIVLMYGKPYSSFSQSTARASKAEFGAYGYNYEALKLFTTHGFPATPVFMTFLGNSNVKLARIAAKGDQSWNFTGGHLMLQTFYNNTLHTRMYIKSNGNVGIGTSDPRDRLAVNGTIRARRVRVMTDIQLADYVFEDDYALMPLSEVEAFVAQHKHLPGLPSARQVKAEGLELAEFQNKLLEKIEELTLHAIAQEKRIQAQEQRLQAQRKRLDALEKENITPDETTHENR